MADAKKKDAAKPADAPKKRGGKLGFYTLATLLVLASPFIFPTIILVLIGLVPTLVELFTDDDPNHASTAAVGALNFAGLSPFLIDLWLKGQTIDSAFHIMGESSFWLFGLGAAGIGKLIVFAVPQAMMLLTFSSYEIRLKGLRQNLEQLKTTWGPDVGTVKPIDKIERI